MLTADSAFARTSGGSVDATSDLGQVVSGSTASERGRYRFDGPLLELAFDDGHTERAGAFFTGDDRQTLLAQRRVVPARSLTAPVRWAAGPDRLERRPGPT